MQVPPNPIDILETYFQVELKPKTLGEFDRIDSEHWFDFAKHYLAVMEAGFAQFYLSDRASQAHAVRLYFEPSFDHAWGEVLTSRFEETPLLTYREYLPDDPKITRGQVSNFLNPLKKHLLLADAIYLRDNFYWGFDAVADSVSRDRWRASPNVANLVNRSIARIRAFLPILAELRELIQSGSLVFVPYYIAPTFPYANIPRELQHHVKRLRINDPSGDVWKLPVPIRDFEKVMIPWLNARLLGLDPVYLNDDMARMGAALRFDDDDDAPRAPPADLLSVNILPFGSANEIDLDTLWNMRRNEPVFAHIRKVTTRCKEHLETNLGQNATPVAANILTKQFLQDHLASLGSQKIISFSEKPLVSMVWRTSLAVATAGASEIIGPLASAVLDTSVAKAVLSRCSPERRAIAYLNASL